MRRTEKRSTNIQKSNIFACKSVDSDAATTSAAALPLGGRRRVAPLKTASRGHFSSMLTTALRSSGASALARSWRCTGCRISSGRRLRAKCRKRRCTIDFTGVTVFQLEALKQ